MVNVVVQGVRVRDVLERKPATPCNDASQGLINIAIGPLINQAKFFHKTVNRKLLPVNHDGSPLRKGQTKFTRKMDLCYNAAIMKFSLNFANNNNNDDDEIIYRWAKLC